VLSAFFEWLRQASMVTVVREGLAGMTLGFTHPIFIFVNEEGWVPQLQAMLSIRRGSSGMPYRSIKVEIMWVFSMAQMPRADWGGA
jgi:hypothetical protein